MGCEPDRYLQFANERLRPALNRILDLGCDPVTRRAVLDCLSGTTLRLAVPTGITLLFFRRLFIFAQR